MYILRIHEAMLDICSYLSICTHLSHRRSITWAYKATLLLCCGSGSDFFPLKVRIQIHIHIIETQKSAQCSYLLIFTHLSHRRSITRAYRATLLLCCGSGSCITPPKDRIRIHIYIIWIQKKTLSSLISLTAVVLRGRTEQLYCCAVDPDPVFPLGVVSGSTSI